MNKNNKQGFYESVFIARQPIFTAKQKVWGYELLFRHASEAVSAKFPDSEAATAKVIVDGFETAQTGIIQGTKLFINFPRLALLNEIPLLLPAQNVIIEILEDVQPDDQIIELCKKFKKYKYIIALDDFQGANHYQKLLPLVDIVKVDVLGLQKQEIQDVLTRLRDFKGILLAEKVEDQETFALTRDLGCKLFQGFFFSKPEVVPGRTIPTNQLAKLKLLNLLSEKEEFEPRELVQVIETDVGLSYKLLRYINSPALGLSNTINSILRAINILGIPNILRWFRVLILSELTSSRAGQELALISAQRARFLQLLGEQTEEAPSTESLFLLGLFSLLDAMLDQPMEKVVTHLPLEKELSLALLGKETRFSPWLQLVKAQEQAQWDQVMARINQLAVLPQTVASCYTQALQWADELLHGSASSGTH